MWQCLPFLYFVVRVIWSCVTVLTIPILCGEGDLIMCDSTYHSYTLWWGWFDHVWQCLPFLYFVVRVIWSCVTVLTIPILCGEGDLIMCDSTYHSYTLWWGWFDHVWQYLPFLYFVVRVIWSFLDQDSPDAETASKRQYHNPAISTPLFNPSNAELTFIQSIKTQIFL